MRQVVTERNDNFYFLPFSSSFNLSAWSGAIMVFFNFFGIFSYSWGWNETEWQDLFSFFLSLFHPILALNNAILAFFNFFNFFAIFFGIFYNASGRNGTEGNENFFHSLSHHLSTDFCLKWSDNSIFFYFLNYFAIFLEFSIMRQVVTERNDNFYFLPFSSSFNLWCLEMER